MQWARGRQGGQGPREEPSQNVRKRVTQASSSASSTAAGGGPATGQHITQPVASGRGTLARMGAPPRDSGSRGSGSPPLPGSDVVPEGGGLRGRSRSESRAILRERLAGRDLGAQVELVCNAPARHRAELLELLPEPEKVIPRLPEAELCFVVSAVGVADGAWILEHATPEQLVACVDLAAWGRDELPDRPSLDAWLDAFRAAGDTTLLRAAHALDPELLVLEIRHRAEVWMKPNDDEGWQPPAGARSEDGVFYYRARHEGDDLASLVHLLRTLFQEDYWLYFRLLQGAIWELESDCEAWAERWRSGRLEDLGFPPREEAIGVYARLESGQMLWVPAEARALDVSAWRLPVLQPRLPVAPDAREPLFRAAAGLDAEERAAFLYAFLALVVRVAVADRMPLGDPESIPTALERAAELARAGLALLAEEHGLEGATLLRHVPVARLFRVGANLLGVRPPVPPEEDEEEGDGEDEGTGPGAPGAS